MKFAILLILTVLLSGCTNKQDPVDNINDGIQQNANELIDYANNNMVIDADKQLLIQGVKDCAARADAMAQACSARVETCKIQTEKTKEERNTFALAFFGLIVLLLWNKFKHLL